jgi:hypothetical protein
MSTKEIENAAKALIQNICLDHWKETIEPELNKALKKEILYGTPIDWKKLQRECIDLVNQKVNQKPNSPTN